MPRLGSWEVKDGLELETTADTFPLWKSPLVPVHPTKILYKTRGCLGHLWAAGAVSLVSVMQPANRKQKKYCIWFEELLNDVVSTYVSCYIPADC